jgi:hypothetical protein
MKKEIKKDDFLYNTITRDILLVTFAGWDHHAGGNIVKVKIVMRGNDSYLKFQGIEGERYYPDEFTIWWGDLSEASTCYIPYDENTRL